MIYFFVLFLLLFLSFQYDINGKTKYRDEWYYIVLVFFILIAGLRWRLCMDTPNYIDNFYHEYPTLEDFLISDYPIGKDPAWVLLNAFVKELGGRFYWIQLFEATVINVLVFKYIKKHSSNLFTCLFFYSFTCYIGYSMEIMRAAFSITICLYANDYILERKWVKAYSLFFLALLFHGQTILMFVLPLLFYLRLNRKGILVLAGVLFAGHMLQMGFSDYFELIELGEDYNKKIAKYAESDFYGSQTGNFNNLVVMILPNLVFSLFSLFYVKKYIPQSNLLILEPFIMLGAIFLILQINIQIAYRFVDYFRIIFVIYYAEVFVTITKQIKRVSPSVAFFRTIVLLSPYFFLMGYSISSSIYVFYPYSSVIERRIDKKRENFYNETFRPSPDVNEY